MGSGKNGKIVRVDDEFKIIGEEFARKNNITFKMATREIAGLVKDMQGKKKVKKWEIKF